MRQPIEIACIGAKDGGVVGNGNEIQTQREPLLVFTGKL